MFDKIFEETPQYFEYDPIIKFNGKNVLGWDNKDSILSFGNDLLSDRHGSKIVNSWFMGTEEIINKIYYK